jgi:NAD(P)-dependent dehydrogenase (short-subunit alcohol dehydrogenase family)
MRKKPLHQQVLAITGASSGLGRAIARAAGARGATVVLAARNGEALENGVREIEDAGSSALAVPTDVTDLGQVQALVAQAVARYGRIDTFVANAMVTVYAEVEDLEPQELRQVLDVNFVGVVNSFWASLPALKASRGTFVHVSSALAYRGIPLQAPYCASKAAARTFLESARVELQKNDSGVAVSLVLPAAIDTPQFDRDRQKIGYQPQPVPPIYEPEPFAAAVLRCCERPVRELPVGWPAQQLLWAQKLAPRLVDWRLRRVGWRSQHTDERKQIGAPDNLFRTLPGDPGARGRFARRSRKSTAWTSARLLRWLS